MKQPSSVKRLKTTHQTCEEVPLDNSMDELGALPQDLINDLPEGCIAEIFRHLEDPEDRQSCTAVCWKWAKLLVFLQPNFWGPFGVYRVVHPCLHLSGHDVVDSKLAAAVVDICSRDEVTDLDLCCQPNAVVPPGLPHLSDDGIHFLTSTFRNLKLVCLDHCLSLTNKVARTIASNCPQLQSLMLIQSCLSDDGISEVANKCTSLVALHVEGGVPITRASLRALAQNAKSLMSLTLGSCPLIKEDDIMSFLMDWPYLIKLELKGMMAEESDYSVNEVCQAESQVSYFDGAGLSSTFHMTSYLSHALRSLFLVNCPGLQDSSMFKFAHIGLPMLENLMIEDCSGVTQTGLIYLVSNARMLKTIKLIRFYFFTWMALMEVLSLCNTTIESLSLDSCDFDYVMPFQSFCDFDYMMPFQSGEPVPQECPQLQVISLEHCESVAQLFLAWIADVCRGLKELRMIGFTETVKEHDIFNYMCSIVNHNRITEIEMRTCQVTDLHISILFALGEAPHESAVDECCRVMGEFVRELSAMRSNLIKMGLSGTEITEVEVMIPIDCGREEPPVVMLTGRDMANPAMDAITTPLVTIIAAMDPLVYRPSQG